MTRKLLPLLFLIAGLGAGASAGLILGPTKPDGVVPETEYAGQEGTPKSDHSGQMNKKSTSNDKLPAQTGDAEYLKLTRQFVVPVVEQDRIAALVTVSLGLEAKPGISEKFYALEPKLRDGFLQVLFDHSNKGGFDGIFTASDNLDYLKVTLLNVARQDLGDDVSRVLIMSIARQDT